MPTRDELDEIAWNIIRSQPVLDLSKDRGQRPLNYKRFGEQMAAGVDIYAVWSSFLHAFYNYKDASFFAQPAPPSLSIEWQALLAATEQGSQRNPHPDLADFFSPIKSLYCISLAEALGRFDPKRHLEYMLEMSWEEEPRGRSEISEAAHLLWNQIWYTRHRYLRAKEEEKAARSGRSAVLVGQDAAKQVEEEFGLEKLGPWTDFEWGMINGSCPHLTGLWEKSGTCLTRDSTSLPAPDGQRSANSDEA